MDPKANVLDAASRVFARHGFRKTSMSMVADEAALSRQAIYHHYASKEALFAALVDQLHMSALERARLAGSKVDVQEIHQPLFAALDAYHHSLVATVARSPFVTELLEESARHCGDVVAAHARKLEELLLGLVKAAVRDGHARLKQGLSEKELVRLVLVASKGVKLAYAQAGAKAYSPALRQMIEVVCDGSVARTQVYQLKKQTKITAGRSKQ